MSIVKSTSKVRNFIYVLFFIVGTAGAYQLGALLSKPTTQDADDGAEVVSQEAQPKASEIPKTIDFKLKNQVVNAWDLPEFKLKDVNGKEHSLSDWKGKLILLNFWATWCPPCRFEIPEFMEYQNEYGKDGLQIIGIGIGEEKSIQNFARTLEMNYPVLITNGADIMKDWGNETQILPYSVLIGRDGRIIYIHRGQLGKLSFKYEVYPHIQADKNTSQ